MGFPPGPGRPSGVPVLRVARLEASRGERIGIVGPNGAGKTTLLRALAGELPLLEGSLRIGAAVQLGYLAQLRGMAFPGATVLDAVLDAAPVDNGVARSYLARFLFHGDEVFKPVAELSGGERSRLELALLGITPANLLLLDEPTNHLDIPAREALETFLRESRATLLVVSHDRRLLETVCRALWVVESGSGGEPGRVAPFDGGYREWRAAVTDGWTVAGELARHEDGGMTRALPAGSAHAPLSAAAGAAVAHSLRPSDRSRLAAARHRSDPSIAAPARQPATRERSGRASRSAPALSKDAYRRQKATIEADLTRLGLRKSHLELALADAGVQSNFVELRRLSSELADVDEALARAEDAWLAVEERAPR